MRIISRLPMTARNDSPLTRKAPASPVAATATPAMAGPTARAPLKIAELRPMALVRSALPSTISTMNAWRAGMSIAWVAPRAMANTITCHTWTTPVPVRAARMKASIIWIVCVTRMIDRRGKRSAIEPPQGQRNEGHQRHQADHAQHGR